MIIIIIKIIIIIIIIVHVYNSALTFKIWKINYAKIAKRKRKLKYHYYCFILHLISMCYISGMLHIKFNFNRMSLPFSINKILFLLTKFNFFVIFVTTWDKLHIFGRLSSRSFELYIFGLHLTLGRYAKNQEYK